MKKLMCKILFLFVLILTFNSNAYAAEKVTMSSTNITLGKGQVYTLTVSNTGNKTVTWKSSNKAIATVDKNGKVTAIKNGTTYITATIKKTKLSCKVTVTKVSLNKSSVTLIKGKTQNLSITGLKTKKITWKSTNETIITVKSGKVTAVAKGTAYIIATVNEKAYKCKVVVESPSISKTSATIASGEILKLKISGTNQKITWTSSNTSVATVSSSGKVKGIKKGTVTITANISGVKYKCKFTICTKRYSIGTKTAGTYEKWYTSVASDDGTAIVVPWKSSNENIVKVIEYNGKYLLIAKGIGQATLTAVKNNEIYEMYVVVNDSGTIIGWQTEKEKEIFTLINQKRNAQGLASVTLNVTLDSSVKNEIANECGFSYSSIYFHNIQEGLGVATSGADRTAEQIVNSIPERYLYDSTVSIVGMGCYFVPTETPSSIQFYYSVSFSAPE